MIVKEATLQWLLLRRLHRARHLRDENCSHVLLQDLIVMWGIQTSLEVG